MSGPEITVFSGPQNLPKKVRVCVVNYKYWKGKKCFVATKLNTLVVDFKTMVFLDQITAVKAMYEAPRPQVHDYEHPGTNNAYHVSMNNILARTYNDQHVLENHSLSMGLELMCQPEYNFLHAQPKETQMAFRGYMIDMGGERTYGLGLSV